jgi:AcrR family transcriptional regulator
MTTPRVSGRRPPRTIPTTPAVTPADAPARGLADSARRRAIVQIAGELFARNGVANTTVRDIADHVGLHSGSLYHHFAAKEDIIAELLSEFMADVMARYREVLAAELSPLDALCGVVRAAVEALGPHWTAANILSAETTRLYQLERFAFVPAAAEEVHQLWVGILRACVKDGSVRPDLDVEFMFRLLRDGVWSIARWYGSEDRGPEDPSLEVIADRFVEYALSGIII